MLCEMRNKFVLAVDLESEVLLSSTRHCSQLLRNVLLLRSLQIYRIFCIRLFYNVVEHLWSAVASLSLQIVYVASSKQISVPMSHHRD